MAIVRPNPAELPAELGEGGSGRIDLGRLRGGGIGGPAELPPPDYFGSFQNVINEIFQLRDRMHGLESQFLAYRFRGRVGPGSPNELPAEMDGGGSGGWRGGGFVPRPGGEIAELPASRLAHELSSMTERLNAMDARLTQALQQMSQRIEGLQKR